MTKKMRLLIFGGMCTIISILAFTKCYQTAQNSAPQSTLYSGINTVYWKPGLEQYPWKNKVGRGEYTNSATQKALFNKEMMFFQYLYKDTINKNFSFYVYTGNLNVLIKNIDNNKQKLFTFNPKESNKREILNLEGLGSEENESDIITAEIWTDDELVIFDYNMEY